jgi:hypothetical protein
MDYLTIRRALGGVLLGAALFFMPFFVLKIFGFLVIGGLFFWLFRGKGYGHHRWVMTHPDHIRSMSDEEYAQFKSKYVHDCGSKKAKSEETPKTKES